MIGTNIFIGSSSEGLKIAEQVQYDLHSFTAPRIWSQGVFGLGTSTLDALLAELRQHDFAVLILSPDDLIVSRDVTRPSPRDNVVFELGLFMGRLGPKRTFLLYDKSVDLKLLSDLAGITKATYDGEWAKVDLPAAIGTACNPIRHAIRRLGPRKPMPWLGTANSDDEDA
jgi:predicted nucleotide-binding protein